MAVYRYGIRRGLGPGSDDPRAEFPTVYVMEDAGSAGSWLRSVPGLLWIYL